MIRGHIEVVTPEVVQGWICSLDGKTRSKTVLAFSGDRCVGSGRVEVFRSDLVQAGLGDGYFGFSFPITVEDSSVGSVTVKLDGSDAVLLQRNAHVSVSGVEAADPGASTGTGTGELTKSGVERQLSMLKWQLEHTRISQADFDYLRILWSFGVYERSLMRRSEVGKAAVADTAIAVATELLECYLGFDAQVIVANGVTGATFGAELKKIAQDRRLAPIVALTSTDRVAIRAHEGSHVQEPEGADAAGPPPHYVDYKLNPTNLIVVDSRIASELYTPAGQSISLVMASPAFA